MSYTPPTLPLHVTWEGTDAYTAPTLPIEVSWQPAGPATVTGTARVTAHYPVVTALADVGASSVITGTARPTAYRPALTATGAIVVSGALQAAGHRPALTARGTVPIVGHVRGAAHRPALTGQSTVLRYVLRGAVRDQGGLVDRTVRAHRLDDGALAGEVQTVGGLFDLDVGFGEDDYYILALDLAPEGTDYAPPIANRVRSVLVQDAPA